MNILSVKNSYLIYKNNKIQIDDLFTDELFNLSNKNVNRYYNNNYVINEVYLKWILAFQALTLFFNKNKIDLIKFQKTDYLLFSLIKDAARKYNIRTIGTHKLFNIKRIFIGNFYILGSMFYLIIQMLLRPFSENPISRNNAITVIRTPAARNKMEFIKDIDRKYENFIGKKTLYNCFKRSKRVKWVLLAWIKSYSELSNYKKMIYIFIGKYSAVDLFYYYSKRIIHTLLYRYLMDEYFSINRSKIFYSGNNLDRFALIEEETAKKYSIKTVCIPHGLEYGFKLPRCFTGDIFYTTSKEAEKQLNNLYITNKFVFDSNIAKKMFEVLYNKMGEKRVVFFSEPREIDVNRRILRELLPIMEGNKIQLYVKLHPKDQKHNYFEYEKRIVYLEDFNEAIKNNICFSRKSTILLEAIYNGSKAGAVLLNQKDKSIFNNFPSLQDNQINIFYTTNELAVWLKEEYMRFK